MSGGNNPWPISKPSLQHIPNQWYHSDFQKSTAVAALSNTNIIQYHWFPIPVTKAYQSIALPTQSGVSLYDWKAGIWANNGNSNMPGAVIFDPASTSVVGPSGVVYSLYNTILPSPGVWVGAVGNGGVTMLFASVTASDSDTGDIDILQARNIQRYQSNYVMGSSTTVLPAGNGPSVTFVASVNAGIFIKLQA